MAPLARVCRPAVQPTIDPTHGVQIDHWLHLQSTWIGKKICSFKEKVAEKFSNLSKQNYHHQSWNTRPDLAAPSKSWPMLTDEFLSVALTVGDTHKQVSKARDTIPGISTLITKTLPGVLQPFAKEMIPVEMQSIKRTFMMSTSSRLSILKDTEPIPKHLLDGENFKHMCV